jgi:hypothetical protein
LLTIGNLFGRNVATIIMVQLTLIERLPWLGRRIGVDRLTSWDRWPGLALFRVVLLHASFVVLGFARCGQVSPLRTFVSPAGQPATLLGITAAPILIALVVARILMAFWRNAYHQFSVAKVVPGRPTSSRSA